jgi:hypothetical protein
MSAKSRHRVLGVPRLMAVTIFSASTIAGGDPRTAMSPPRRRRTRAAMAIRSLERACAWASVQAHA